MNTAQTTLQTPVTLAELRTRFVVRPKILEKQKRDDDKAHLLNELERIGELVSAEWQGPKDATQEIRSQRGEL